MFKNFKMRTYVASLIVVLLVPFLTLCISCDSSSSEARGTLQLSLQSDARFRSRNINPEGSTPLEITSFLISGEGPNSQTLAPMTAAEKTITINSLLVGDWTFTATGLNSSGTAIATGSTSIHISKHVNSAQITLDSEVGSGFFNLICQWDPAQTSPNSTIELTLLNMAEEQVTGITKDVDLKAGQATFSAPLAAGYYSVLVNIKTDGEIISGYVETLRIIDQTTSQATRTLEIGKVIDSGTLVIIDDTATPIEGAIILNPTELTPGDSATLTFTPENSVATMTVQWYREGVLIDGATNLQLSIPSVQGGTYRYDIVVSIPEKGTVGSAGILVAVPTTATLQQ
ncbi:MAG: hypothetical protein WCS59_01510 [Sphaerochaetaceae bacterium]|nr:hypothetical protein [Sphaerochaetaceae bacterium]MDD4219536.1 hypothetical protein [Sphaerochaetaceae bacterium]MDY0371659.1 hypothetical protein [Sphaerochaetaceae bacterium]